MKRIIVSLLTFLLITLSANAKIKVTGKVIDKANKGIFGASVTVKNTTVGTVTDIEGNYSIEVPKKGDTLVFSMVGVPSVEKVCDGKNLINVQLNTMFDIAKSNKIMLFDETNTKVFEKQDVKLPDTKLNFKDFMSQAEYDKLADGEYFYVISVGKNLHVDYLTKGTPNGIKFTISKMLYKSKDIAGKKVFVEIDDKKIPVTDNTEIKGARIKLNSNRIKIIGKMPYRKSASLIIGDKEIPIDDRVDDSLDNDFLKMELHSPSENEETLIVMEKDTKKKNLFLKGKSGAPLYIIDGVFADATVLKEISPDSIRNITILKDKAAITLYGEKAKNGVILITTKK
ncbi:TonB-dependent SusC/RagA subfamily outer membrane receptor [Balneicella halophila]|uniref:TonB-dependent SusC/RagA subfamily outer membrane receptor n=1 Tax=Balneicella halophila TaxID=1537566 RepID=A0A7L4UMT9_BALHA|nr:carboxypeptidase-like regulatory domain-containing protein [Balneicella halophila]PVX49941.1 TonB-dependent SusC/RagA subfamily outer membrane receptor [Balneicella halophila]